MSHPALPIINILPQLLDVLGQRDEAIVVAPPGAGKTTQIPLSLLDAKWLGKQKVLMLEPRRLAARAAAYRMASMLGEKAGQTIGYRIRHDTCVSQQTRVEVVTEGILTRMIQNNPALDGIGIVIFDEFHERSLEADLGLALILQARQLFREDIPLKLLLMSATLDDEAIARLLDSAPIIRSEGKMYPVEVHYSDASKPDMQKLAEEVAQKVNEVFRQEQGSMLVFLPGQKEIQQVYKLLAPLQTGRVMVTPLYGNLSLDEQNKAIEAVPEGRRKIVLATDIAETSLTIHGIRVVIDAGLSRKPVFDPASGMTRLHTKRLSRTSSVQRMGRAGRTEAGSCYRLWSASQQQQLIAYTAPEILQADLVPLALQLLLWGVDDPAELQWLDPPPVATYQQAIQLLQQLGALRKKQSGNSPMHWTLSEHGNAMAHLPLHPRLAHMLLMGQHFGLYEQACMIAAILSERDPFQSKPGELTERDADIQLRIDFLKTPTNNTEHLSRGINRAVLKRIRSQLQDFRKLEVGSVKRRVNDPGNPVWTGFLIALAYPERIAQQRQAGSTEYRMSSGRAAQLEQQDLLQQHPYLAIAQAGSYKGASSERIYLAAPLDESFFKAELATQVEQKQSLYWDNSKEKLVAEEQSCIGQLVIRRKESKTIAQQDKQKLLLELIRQRGLGILPWTDELRQWQSRILLLRELERCDEKSTNDWPDVSDAELLNTLENWLAPYLENVNQLKHFAELDLKQILGNMLDWTQQKKLDEQAPVRIEVPSGSLIRIDYLESPPVLAVRLQEMFGCETTPTIANHKIALKIHLLSPAQRPLQVTQDLATFWKNTYQEVKREMKGRYPKHIWPDDPLKEGATRYTTKKKGRH